MKLTPEELIKYARIMFQNREQIKQQIDKLTVDQLQTLRSIYAQKICYQIVNPQISRQTVEDSQKTQTYNLNQQQDQIHHSLWMSIFCCCYPEFNRDQYQITTPIFLQRALYPLLFWRSEFFQIDDGQTQSYGIIWMLFLQFLILWFASFLNSFYIDPINYQHDYALIGTCFAIVFIFKIIQPLIHSGAIGCLGSFITNDQCMMLSSYSLTTYLIPTVLCIVPSVYWKVMLLSLGSIFRIVFLFRNYSKKLQARRYILFFTLVIIEVFYLIITYQSLFQQASLGFGFSEGFAAVFGTTPTVQQTVQSINPQLIQQFKKFIQTKNTTGQFKLQHTASKTLRHFLS